MAKKPEVRLTKHEAMATPIPSARPLNERFEQVDIPEELAQPIPGFVRCKVIDAVKNHAPGDPVLVKYKDVDSLAGCVEPWDGAIEDFEAGISRLEAAAEKRNENNN